MDNIFRSFFGFPSKKNPCSKLPAEYEAPFENPHLPMSIEDDEDDNNGIHDSFSFGHGDSPFFTHPSDIFQQFDDMFATFDHIFRSFGMPSIDNGSENIVISTLPAPEDHEVSPRDRMLKKPDLVPTPPGEIWRDDSSQNRSGLFGRLWNNPAWDRRTNIKRDEDVDDSIRAGGLDSIFGKDEAPIVTRPSVLNRGSAFQSVSVHTYCGPDGKVEERRTMVDGNGNQQTVITRSMDGKTLKQTTKCNKNGEQEVIEDLINMDEKDKDSFEQKWQMPKSHGRNLDMLPRNELLQEPDIDRSDSSLFRRLFGFNVPGQK